MKTKASLALVLLAGVLATAGCSTTSRTLPPGKDVVKQIGLPMYPHGVTLLRAQEITMGSKFGATTTIS